MLNPNRDQFPLGLPIALPAPSSAPAVSTYPLPAADMTTTAEPALWPVVEPPRERFGADKPGAGANRIGALLAPEAHELASAGLAEYRVEIGHISLAIQCSSPEEAIRLARTRLCLELPRLWDIIRTMDASRFKVVIVK